MYPSNRLKCEIGFTYEIQIMETDKQQSVTHIVDIILSFLLASVAGLPLLVMNKSNTLYTIFEKSINIFYLNTYFMDTQGNPSKRSYVPADVNYRTLAIILILIQVAVMVSYGISGKFYEEGVEVIGYSNMFYTMMLMVFTIVGFGLLLNAYKFGTWLGTGTTIIATALNIQLAPLFQKFWFSVFISGFGTVNRSDQVGSAVKSFWMHYETVDLEVGYYSQQTTMIGCISLFVLFTAFIGRLNLNNVITVTVFFTFFWNMCYFVLVRIFVIVGDFNSTASPQFAPYFFDAFGTSYIYLFAGFFGVGFAILFNKLKFPINAPTNDYNRISLVMAAVGTAFIYATFIFATNNFYSYSGLGTSMGRLAIMFALSASVIGCYFGSIFKGNGRVGFKQALTGTISGGVAIGSVAPVIDNIGIIIVVGLVAGLISGVYMKSLHLKINANYTYDVLGLYGPFLISSIIGSMIVAPALIANHYNRNIVVPTIGVQIPDGYAGWQLVFTGVSAGAGLVTGLITGALTICDRSTYGLGSNSRYFANDFGLYTPTDDDEMFMGTSESAKSLEQQ